MEEGLWPKPQSTSAEQDSRFQLHTSAHKDPASLLCCIGLHTHPLALTRETMARLSQGLNFTCLPEPSQSGGLVRL
jgi:hypothetical protein